MTTWRRELEDAMKAAGDPGPVIKYAPAENDFDVVFDENYGREQGKPVLAWTNTRVYFPVGYDGSEWLGSAPRDPQEDGQGHVGG